MDESMNAKTISSRWLVAEGFKIALILLVGFALARVGADLLGALPLFPWFISELWTDVARYATILTAVLYTVAQATLQANTIRAE